MMYGRAKMAGGGSNKKRFQYCTDSSGENYLPPSSPKVIQDASPIDPLPQDNASIPKQQYFEYIYHIGCAISLHSITNSGLTPGGQNSSKDRQTVFFTGRKSHA